LSQPDCIFCKIVRGEIPSREVARDQMTLAFEDLNPQAPVHVLVIPIEHHDDAHALPGATLEAMYAMARRVTEEKGIAQSGYRMVFNIGPDSGQTVFHAHLHVLGGRRMAWPPG
jgi:histidine triad (HIT) family protein